MSFGLEVFDANGRASFTTEDVVYKISKKVEVPRQEVTRIVVPNNAFIFYIVSSRNNKNAILAPLFGQINATTWEVRYPRTYSHIPVKLNTVMLVDAYICSV